MSEELKPCPFCGGKAALRMSWMEDGHRYRAVECVECGATTPGNYSEVGDQSVWDWNTRMLEQAIAATLGSKKLTAEQVEKVIMSSDYWERVNNHPALREGVWQAIADELNAALGAGECEWELEHSGTLYDKWRCSECKFLFVEPRCDQGYTDLVPNYCPNCGRKVER